MCTRKLRVKHDARLKASTAHHLDYHIEETGGICANFELQALTPDYLATIAKSRQQYEALPISVLDEGKRRDVIGMAEMRVATYTQASYGPRYGETGKSMFFSEEKNQKTFASLRGPLLQRQS